MKYSEVLYLYQPLETGDFMYRYSINNREYIVYSPEDGKISCLEMYNFKELTPYQLAVYIQMMKPLSGYIEVDEFSFEHICSKDELINYLFDVTSDKTDNLKVRGVSNNEGYFLFELKPTRKIRNFYQYNPNNQDYQLVFDNEICYAAILENVTSDTINVCWNPYIFSVLEKDVENRNTSYLLPSANQLVCAFVCNKVQERSTKLCLHVGDDCLNALLLIAYYIGTKDLERGFAVFCESNKIVISMKNWHPIRLIKYVSKIQNIYNKKVSKLYGDEMNETITIFQLDSFSGLSFISFPNNNIAIYIFLNNIIEEIGIEDIIIK